MSDTLKTNPPKYRLADINPEDPDLKLKWVSAPEFIDNPVSLDQRKYWDYYSYLPVIERTSTDNKVSLGVVRIGNPRFRYKSALAQYLQYDDCYEAMLSTGSLDKVYEEWSMTTRNTAKETAQYTQKLNVMDVAYASKFDSNNNAYERDLDYDRTYLEFNSVAFSVVPVDERKSDDDVSMPVLPIATNIDALVPAVKWAGYTEDINRANRLIALNDFYRYLLRYPNLVRADYFHALDDTDFQELINLSNGNERIITVNEEEVSTDTEINPFRFVISTPAIPLDKSRDNIRLHFDNIAQAVVSAIESLNREANVIFDTDINIDNFIVLDSIHTHSDSSYQFHSEPIALLYPNKTYIVYNEDTNRIYLVLQSKAISRYFDIFVVAELLRGEEYTRSTYVDGVSAFGLPGDEGESEPEIPAAEEEESEEVVGGNTEHTPPESSPTESEGSTSSDDTETVTTPTTGVEDTESP